MFKKNIIKKITVLLGISLVAISAIPFNSANAATTSNNNGDSTNQMFPVDYADQYLAGLKSDITIPNYDLPAETDGYYRTYDQFMSRDMTTWLGSANVAYAKSARNSWLTGYFLYRLSPADDDFGNLQYTVIPDLKKNGGTANLKLQVLNVFNSGQVLREQPITIHVPAPSAQLSVNYDATTNYSTPVTSNAFTNSYLLPSISIKDETTGATYQATDLDPVSSVYLDGKKTEISSLRGQLAAGTYTQSIYFKVAGMSQAQLGDFANNKKIVGNNGDANIRYSGGRLILTRTISVK
ncbi:hypothetical protein [Companilactobacillus mishanensis]|uniref:hypothetical protein n=1 Tax=Companilactobacillus mishanensis TaxID=2486008 RepID=UPI0012961BB0|nr:hypothetical protein [Companilactobacillus mishanensis]MQS88502.1 hypothetical protein [Companilactobacillus mishanensis]